jgi:hypothetical protein
MPLPGGKVIMALYEVVFGKFKLKDFAEAYDLNYGSVRNWRKDKQYAQQMAEFIFEFRDYYISTYKQALYEKENDDAIMAHLFELMHYNEGLWLIIHDHLRDLDLKIIKEDFSREDVWAWNRHRDFYNIYGLLNTQRKDPAEHQKVVQQYLEEEKVLSNIIFDGLKDDIKNNRSTDALKTAEMLERRLTGDLFDLFNFVVKGLTSR